MPETPHRTSAERDRAAWRTHLRRDMDLDQLSSGNLGTAMGEQARHRPEAPALRFPSEPDGHLTHGALAERAARTAGWLAEQGLAPGDRVLLCGHNTSATVIAYLAVLRRGAAVVLANPAYTAAELSYLVTDARARWAWAAEPAAETLRREHPEVSTLSLDEPLPSAAPDEPVNSAPEDLAMLAYTSGTTGAPKGVELTHANLLASIRSAMVSWDWTADDVLVHCLPLSHQHGLGGVHASLLAGSSAVILPKFDPSELAEAIHTYRASVLFAVPAIYERLVTLARSGLSCSSLRLAVSGSAPLPIELAGRIAEIMGVAPLERYGSTESGLDVSNPLLGPRVPGTVGVPLPGVELRVLDSSDAEVASGEDGEIVLRGPQVFRRYWNRPEDTAAAFTEEGWFRTGDIGRIDPATGYLSITGRKKELIITGGMNVYPREVEMALEQHPSVRHAAVAGVASQRWGEEVVAWVQPHEPIDAEQLIEHTRGLLAAYKCPKRIRFAHALPRNSMGKVLKSTLVAELDPPDTTGLERAVGRLWKADLS